MNRKETTASLAIVSMALLATIMTATTPTHALAIDYGSPDPNYQPSGGFVGDGADSSGTSDNTDEDSADEEQEEDNTTGATTGEDEGSEDSSNDEEDSSGLGYETFQDCLADAGESPTEQEVQDCIDSSYSGQDNGEQGPNESANGNDKGDTGVNQELSATDLE
jgi:hypothetical protein